VHEGYLWLKKLIPITAELIHRISNIPYMGRDPVEIASQSRNFVLAKAMKKKYSYKKKQRGYAISSIQDEGMCIATQLLAGKLIRKCCSDEVPTMVIALAEQSAEGVQFNTVQFLYEEFLTICKEAQEHGNTFHYAWLLLSILLVVR